MEGLNLTLDLKIVFVIKNYCGVEMRFYRGGLGNICRCFYNNYKNVKIVIFTKRFKNYYKVYIVKYIL